ncbi:MAG: hypothetical protein ACYDBT_14170 [Desulfobulbaceae bacterium]
MKSPMVIFGLRDLPRPRGLGFLYCKLAPDFREKILVEYDLDTEAARLTEIYKAGIKNFFALELLDPVMRNELLANYDTENMQPHAREILNKVLGHGSRFTV